MPDAKESAACASGNNDPAFASFWTRRLLPWLARELVGARIGGRRGGEADLFELVLLGFRALSAACQVDLRDVEFTRTSLSPAGIVPRAGARGVVKGETCDSQRVKSQTATRSRRPPPLKLRLRRTPRSSGQQRPAGQRRRLTACEAKFSSRQELGVRSKSKGLMRSPQRVRDPSPPRPHARARAGPPPRPLQRRAGS